MKAQPLDLSELRADAAEGARAIARKRGTRSFYKGADINRFTQDWITLPTTPDQELRFNLRRLRARARDLARNTPHGKKFMNLVRKNIVGPYGFKFRAEVETNAGTPDTVMNKRLTAAWTDFCLRENFTVDGRMNAVQTSQLVASTVAMDGEVLIRKVRGYDNEHGFALQMLDADQLDETYSIVLANGNRVRMGVEVNGWNKPVAYHILTNHPSDYTFAEIPHKRERVPAEEIIHLFVPYRVNQTRGVTWFAAVMGDVRMHAGYREAELIAARVGAAKGGFFETAAEVYEPENRNFNETPTLKMDANPGVFEQLPPGITFKPFTPDHPTAGFAGFEKAILRSVATGLEVSYSSLTGDLESVNYSSIRQGELDARDGWKMAQEWLAEAFLRQVYIPWLQMAELKGVVTLDARPPKRFHSVCFMGRGWPWVDPLKDAQATVLRIANRLGSRTEAIEQEGNDYESVIAQLAKEDELAEEAGLPTGTTTDTLPKGVEKPGNPPPPANEEDDPNAQIEA